MTELASRQSHILEAIIREYIRTAEPVGSAALAQHYHIAASPATIRNDMADLENAGYLAQPHTSAGRVPTKKAYHYYIEFFMKEKPVAKREAAELKEVWQKKTEDRMAMKLTAKLVASFSDESAFWAFGKNEVYYTGIANLFNQPEFQDHSHIYDMGAVIDELDQAVARMYKQVTEDVNVFIGEETNLADSCSVIVTRCEMPRLGEGLFGLLGPTRMDYEANVARVKYIRDFIIQYD